MRPAMRTAMVLALAAVGLAGCSSNKISEGQDRLFLHTLRQALQGKGKKPKPNLTRAQITATKLPLYEAVVPKRDAKAYMLKIGTNGDVVTWSSTDGIMVSLRKGVLIQTRGFGRDLMSSAQVPLAMIARGTGTAQATYYYLDGNDQQQALPLRCQLSRGAASNVTIAEITYRLREVRVACTGADTGFTNRFWLDAKGHVRKSHQWISQDVGYIDLADLQR